MFTDEEFDETYRILAGDTVSTDDKITYLRHIDVPKDLEILPHLHAIVEKNVIPTDPVGYMEYRIEINENEATLRRTLNIIENQFSRGTFMHNREFCIDGIFLKHQIVIDFLNRLRQNGYIDILKILGEDYVLDEDTYNQLSQFDLISVDNSNVIQNNIDIRNRAYDYSAGINENCLAECDAFIKEDMSDEELLNLIHELNNINNPVKKVNIRFYNPVKTVEMIERLDRLGLDNNIDIKILGYPLVESSEVYQRLESIANKRNIEVSYTCCHDYLGDYCEEPYLVDNSYFSELEPHGKTDFKTYMKILQFVEEFQKNTADVQSNLEKVMMAYQFLNENYYYDLNSGRTKNYGATRDLDKIIDTDEIVCVGYANLLSIMCRRVGIPMFTYGAPQHYMNVARIVEKDEQGNVIFDKICTFDPTNDCGYYEEDPNSLDGRRRVDNKDSYTFFGLDPEIWLHHSEPSHMTLANALAITGEDVDRYQFFSKSYRLSKFVGGYAPRSYMPAMLSLMGYSFNPGEINLNDLVAQLQEEGRIGEIPKELIYRTAESIENRKNGTSLSGEAIDRINTSFDLRNIVFDSPVPRINANYMNDTEIPVRTYKQNIPEHNYIDINAIDVGPQYFEEIENLRTGNTRSESPIENPNQSHIEPLGQSTNEEEHQIGVEVDTPPPRSAPNEISASLPEPINEETSTAEPISMFTEEDFSEGFIAGTLIRRPRERGIYETDEEYVEFLRRYYEYYFPETVTRSSQTFEPTLERLFTEEDFSDGYILGTDVRRPRARETYETDEEYVEFLREYYEHFFPNTKPITVHMYDDYVFKEDDFQDELIPGTDIRKPRMRGIYETDEEYEEFLEMFYAKFFKDAEPVTVRIGDNHNFIPTERHETPYGLTSEQIIQDDISNRTVEPRFNDDDYQEEYILGTYIRKPRMRKTYETDEEYEAFLQRYYEYFFPNTEKQPVTTNQADNSSERNSSLYENNKNQYSDYKEKKNQLNDMLNNFDNSQIDYYNEDDDINHIAR